MDKKIQIQPGSKMAPAPLKITILADGPYLIHGKVPLKQQFLMTDERGNNWSFKAGRPFDMKGETTALCRCGASENKPYCDGAHAGHDWDPTLTASREPLLDDAEKIKGPKVTLTDNEKFCAFARICDAKGRVWNLTEVNDERAKEYVIHEAGHCPAGRLSAWDQKTGKPDEPELPVSLGLIEDPGMRCSSALWVRGGIPIETEDGTAYEIRNRVTLCRCGQSSNKPYCDGTHASMRFQDGLGGHPDGEEF